MIFIITTEAYVSRRETMARAYKDTQNLEVTLESYTSSIFRETDNLLQNVQMIYENRGAKWSNDKKETLKTLTRIKSKVPEVEILSIADKNGNIISSTNEKNQSSQDGDAPVNLADRSYFKKHLASNTNEMIISEPLVGRITQHMSVILSRKVFSSDGRFDGIVLAGINLGAISNFYSKIELGPNGAVTLTDSEDYLLAHFPIQPSWIGKPFPKPAELKGHSHGGSGIYEATTEITNGDKIYSYSFFNSLPLLLVIERSKSYILRDWRNTVLFNVAIMLFLMILSSYFHYRYIYSEDEYEHQRTLSIQASKMSSLGEMAAGIAHEITNPLTVIISRAQAIQDSLKVTPPDIATINESVIKIEEIGRRMSRIVKALLSLSRDTNKDEMRPTMVRSIIEKVMDLSQQRFKSKGVVLTFVDPIPEIEIICHETQVTQVILNLMNNAFDAVYPLPDKWVKVDVQRSPANTLLISVTDSGKGIPKALHEKVMQPFFTTKELDKGTGLGLSISQSLVREHKGTLRIDTECPNTRFVIELPINPVSSQLTSTSNAIAAGPA